VEGLSVVAISYYAVSLSSYLLAPFAEGLGVGETMLKAGLVPIVLGLAWMGLRRVRRSMH